MGREEGLLDSVVEPELLVDIMEGDTEEEIGEMELVAETIGGGEVEVVEVVGISGRVVEDADDVAGHE